MSKGLEALQHLYAIASVHTKLEKISYILDLHHAIEKELKALAIIEKKGILVNGLIQMKDLGEYNTLCNFYQMSELLTQEEYDLLKEVLS